MGHFEMLCMRCGYLSQQLSNEEAAQAFFRMVNSTAAKVPAPPRVHYFTNMQFGAADALDLLLFAVVRCRMLDQQLYDIVCMVVDLHEAMDRSGEGGRLEKFLIKHGFEFSRDHEQGYAHVKKGAMTDQISAVQTLIRVAVSLGIENPQLPRTVDDCLRAYARSSRPSHASLHHHRQSHPSLPSSSASLAAGSASSSSARSYGSPGAGGSSLAVPRSDQRFSVPYVRGR